MKRMLITGAGSYIGSSVEEYLLKWPESYAVDTIDMRDGTWKRNSFVRYDSVLHVAGIVHLNTRKMDIAKQQKYWQINAELPVEVAKLAKEAGVKQFIFMSSMSVYGQVGSLRHPIIITRETKPQSSNIYGRSKLAAEEGLLPMQDATFQVCVLRPPMVYGPGSKGNYPLLEKAALRLPLFPDIANQRSMLRIDRLCAYVKEVMDAQSSGIHFPQDPEYACTSRMVQEIAQAHGRSVHLTKMFNPFLRLLSGRIRLVDKVFGSLIYDKSMS